MPRSALLIILMFCPLASFGQNISVTFTGTGAATQVDSVKATNLTTNQSVTLPGNETLLLTTNTGIPVVSELANSGFVYPNPFSGTAIVSISVMKPQTVYLKIHNLFGQVVSETKAWVQSGNHEFDISIRTPGMYIVSFTTDQGTVSNKVICEDATGSVNTIQYRGVGSYDLHKAGFKTSQTGFSLGYTSGEIILYKCFSGIYTTVVTDSLISSKNYEVEFAACTDTDGKNYPIVKIGYQTWMAENLAYLPAVNSIFEYSNADPHYWVYGNKGSIVSEAKVQPNYSTYGVLYDWPTAMNGASGSTTIPSGVQGICPSGWHLPSSGEWKVLTDYLGVSAGGKTKETGTDHWLYANIGATNASGFTALPGGYVEPAWNMYLSLGYTAIFWSTTDSGGGDAGGLSQGRQTDGFGGGIHQRCGVSVRCIQDGPTAPTASFIVGTIRGTTTSTFHFDASTSTDLETSVADLEVRWDWDGDGIWDTGFGKTKTGSKQYASPCTYPVSLEVKDGDDFRDAETQTVVVIDGTFTDSRDGHEYPYLVIGTQTWMIENLAYLPAVSPSTAESLNSPIYYTYGYEGTSVSEAKVSDNYATYGVLYNWEAAKTACPSGWHLPSDVEWRTLTDFLGTVAGFKMMEAGTDHWLHGYIHATNASGFTALPGGHRFNYGNCGFSSRGETAYFWTATEVDASCAWNRILSGAPDIHVNNNFYKKSGFSVRCEKDGHTVPVASFSINPQSHSLTTIFQFDASGSNDLETPSPGLEVRWDWDGDGTWDTGYDTVKTDSHQFSEPGTYPVILEVKDGDGLVDTEIKTVTVSDSIFTDNRDGHEYVYTTIGTQTWMSENLAWLPQVSPSSRESGSLPFYYVHGYNGTNVIDAKTADKYGTYGVLYNWKAALTACPSGWHLPTDEEWKMLEINQGMSLLEADSDMWRYSGVVSGKLKEAGTIHWSSPNTGATNSSGFSALPGGSRSPGEIFDGTGITAGYWTASESTSYGAWLRILINDVDGVFRAGGYSRTYGYSVRCEKDGLTAPIARFSINPPIGATSTNYQFDASGSTDAETTSPGLEVRWDWDGDGIWDTDFKKLKTSSYQYPYPGDYSVMLEVRDEEGLVNTVVKTLTVSEGIFTDDRDGHQYVYGTIGTQTWMTENLAYLPQVSPSNTGSGTSGYYYVYGYEGTIVSAAKDRANYKTYGVLYNWEAAKTACPTGWHLPTDEEWKILEKNQGMEVGVKLKETGHEHWQGRGPNAEANNASGFTALPGGYRDYWGFNNLGSNAYFWSASDSDALNALSLDLHTGNVGVTRSSNNKDRGFSTRCLRD